MKSVFTLLAAAAAVAALAIEPAPLAKRCNVPGPQQWIIDEVYSICRSLNVNDVVLLATFETATVESDWNNLPCGDQDSLGVFQQRPSQDWGTPAQLQDVNYATNAFLKVAIELNKQNPGWPAGVLAQGVQGSERPDAYTQAEQTAKSILAGAEQRAGDGGDGGGAINVAPAPKKGGSSDPKSSPPKSSSSSSSSSSGKDVKAPKNLAEGTIRSGCEKYFTVVAGNTCFALQDKFGISVEHFLAINKGVHHSCNNLEIGQAYCVRT